MHLPCSYILQALLKLSLSGKSTDTNDRRTSSIIGNLDEWLKHVDSFGSSSAGLVDINLLMTTSYAKIMVLVRLSVLYTFLLAPSVHTGGDIVVVNDERSTCKLQICLATNSPAS